jgi:integrative and conjugative element protein (TIGR02256 family)
MFTLKRHENEVRFPVGDSGQTLVLSPKALKVFSKYRQVDQSQPESGGLLLARFDLPLVRVEVATSPQSGDNRSRFLFVSDEHSRRATVRKYFRKGFHFIGEWHTHPQRDPSPSGLDVDSMKDLFRQSVHELNYFVMVIVGNRNDGLSLWVSLHNSTEIRRLSTLAP